MFHHYLTVDSLQREGDGQGGENPDRKRRAEKKNDLKEKTEFQTKKGLQNKQERTSHVEPISL